METLETCFHHNYSPCFWYWRLLTSKSGHQVHVHIWYPMKTNSEVCQFQYGQNLYISVALYKEGWEFIPLWLQHDITISISGDPLSIMTSGHKLRVINHSIHNPNIINNGRWSQYRLINRKANLYTLLVCNVLFFVKHDNVAQSIN